MIRQIRVELTRLRWRRAAVALLLAAIVVPILVALSTAISHSPPSPDDIKDARKSYAFEQRHAERLIPKCVAKPQRYGVSPESADVQAECEAGLRPGPFDPNMYYYSLTLDDERVDGSGIAVAVTVGVLMFLLGTTFAGHDWNTGSMSNQLLAEPRRGKVWAAKAVAVTSTALVVCLIATTVFWLLLNALLNWRGFPPAPDGDLLTALAQGWRTAALAGGAALGGYALTMLTRSTVVSLGLLFGVSLAAGALLNVIPTDPGPISPAINAAAVVQGGADYYVQVPESCYTGEIITEPEPNSRCDSDRHRSLQGGVIHVLVLLGVCGVASVVSFRRRDVG